MAKKTSRTKIIGLPREGIRFIFFLRVDSLPLCFNLYFKPAAEYPFPSQAVNLA
jgi:hypothetical protein